jgi:hypothetical protein
MTRNITLRINSVILKKCRSAAAREDKSLSRWVTDLMTQAVTSRADLDEARRQALRRLGSGFDLGGKPLTRDELHGR